MTNATHPRGALCAQRTQSPDPPHRVGCRQSPGGTAVNFDWVDNSQYCRVACAPNIEWEGPVGSGCCHCQCFRGWEHLRFEVTEEASPGVDGGRWMHTPDLGVFYAQVDAVGNTVVAEDRIIYALEVAEGNPEEITRELRLALGRAWDEELEAFRHAGDATPVVWLHRVG
jgi:hypothetical protein